MNPRRMTTVCPARNCGSFFGHNCFSNSRMPESIGAPETGAARKRVLPGSPVRRGKMGPPKHFCVQSYTTTGQDDFNRFAGLAEECLEPVAAAMIDGRDDPFSLGPSRW